MNNTIVVKIGSSVLFTSRGKLDEFRALHLINQILKLQRREIFVILVISGAVACGAHHYLKNVIKTSHGRESIIQSSSKNKRLFAGIGQTILVSKLFNLFNQKKCTIAQLLLTRDDLNKRYESLVQTLWDMQKTGIIPVINENDVIDLNSFGGNDLLAAKIAQLMNAKLIILSTSTGSWFGVGGGKTKLRAIHDVKKMGLEAVIEDGKKRNCITEAACI